MDQPSPAPQFTDTHAHLDQPEFAADGPAVLQRAAEAGVAALLCVGITAQSSAAAAELAQRHPQVFAAAGIHPNYAAQAGPDDWQQTVRLLDQPRVVAIGETGLDRHWDFTPFDVQQAYFQRHLQLAQERDLPVIIHCRDAEADLMPMLRRAAARGPLRGVLHAFSGDTAVAQECLSLGFWISFAGNVTYTNKKFAALRAAAAIVPDERLLVETDSPYLVPHPLRGKQRRNEPAWVRHTAECLAVLRGQRLAELAALTSQNARQLFSLPS